MPKWVVLTPILTSGNDGFGCFLDVVGAITNRLLIDYRCAERGELGMPHLALQSLIAFGLHSRNNAFTCRV